MFSKCISLKQINLSNFITNDVFNMSEMFLGCSSLKKLDLSSFNTEAVNEMTRMFSGCIALEELDIYNFNFTNVQTKENIFHDCKSLKIVNLFHEQIPYLDKETDKNYLKELKFTSENKCEIDDYYRFDPRLDGL